MATLNLCLTLGNGQEIHHECQLSIGNTDDFIDGFIVPKSALREIEELRPSDCDYLADTLTDEIQLAPYGDFHAYGIGDIAWSVYGWNE